MNIENQLKALQKNQFRHDSVYHKDIFHFSTQDKIKHFVFHLVKYFGNLTLAIVQEQLQQDCTTEIEKNLTDSLVIVLASANALSVDLGKILSSEHNLPAKNLVDYGNKMNTEHEFLVEYALALRGLAKACESLDHLELYPFKEEIKQNLLKILRVVLQESSKRMIDLNSKVIIRLRALETNHPVWWLFV